MTWAQGLKRVFSIQIEVCTRCGGGVKIIPCIEDPAVIQKILDHLRSKNEPCEPFTLPENRAPPGALFG